MIGSFTDYPLIRSLIYSFIHIIHSFAIPSFVRCSFIRHPFTIHSVIYRSFIAEPKNQKRHVAWCVCVWSSGCKGRAARYKRAAPAAAAPSSPNITPPAVAIAFASAYCMLNVSAARTCFHFFDAMMRACRQSS
jgi:hypothetical protein